MSKVKQLDFDQNEKLREILEDAQEAIISVGGHFIRQKELRRMPLEMFLGITIPNHVDIKITGIKDGR